MEVIVSVANSEHDFNKIKTFAEEAGVSTEGIHGDEAQFLIMTTTKGEPIATLGIENIEEYALLRTLIADAKLCTSQKLYHLFDVAVGTARTQGQKAVFFFTPAKPDVFGPLGFKAATPAEIPDVLFKSNHFKRTLDSKKANLLISEI